MGSIWNGEAEHQGWKKSKVAGKPHSHYLALNSSLEEWGDRETSIASVTWGLL